MQNKLSLPAKHLFHLPDGVIYLDGNSLGPLPVHVPERLETMLKQEWGEKLIGGWNDAGWMEQPSRIGDRIARLIGAPKGSVTMGDTLSIKVFQAISAALAMRPDRKIILSDTGNFPTDLYMANGLVEALGQGHTVRTVEPEKLLEAIDETVAAVLLTEVDYRTGRKHDMMEITKRSHDAGAIVIWDLAHSAGALPVHLEACACEFAVGCTYKYLNGGPGAPAFIYVRPDLIESVRPILAGWLGHAAPFAFDPDYQPAPDIERMRVGTPPVMQLSALEAALDLWDRVDLQELRAASIALSELFIKRVEQNCPQLTLASPRDPQARGSQVSFHFSNGYAAIQALISRGVIGDFRAPDIMRFGFTPLYLDEADVIAASEILIEIITDELWDQPEFLKQKRVT